MKQRTPVLLRESMQHRDELQSHLRPRPSLRRFEAHDELLHSEENLLPSIENYACILQRCRKDLALVLHLHALLQKSGLETLTLLGNYLISILVDVGRINAAQQVFDRLLIQNDGSWRSLVIGYVKCGKPQHALTLYRQRCMYEYTYLNGPTSVALLKACAELKDLELGNEIHAEIARTGLLEKDLFVGSTLMDMYAKCGMLAKTQQVFDKLTIRNVVSWNTLLAAYAKHGFGHKTLKYFDQMQLEGVSPDPVTFVCSLRACTLINAIDKGQEIHDEVERQGLLEKDYIIGSALVDMHVKGGSFAKAKQLFDKLAVRDVVSWTAMITGYTEQGDGVQALRCLEQMQVEGISPDAVALVCILQACGSVGAQDKGQQLHAVIVSLGLLHDNHLVGNALVDMYAKCGFLPLAQKVFDKLPVRDVVSWNSLIVGYIEQGHAQEALKHFEQMRLERVPPNAVTYVCSLKACGCIEAMGRGQEIHAEIERRGLETDLLVGNTLVDMYAKCGFLVKAQQVFDKLPARTEVSWTSLIAGYVKHGHGQEALSCFERMVQEGLYPDSVTFACGLKACSVIGATNKGEEIHALIKKKQCLERDVTVSSTLVDMYVKCGLLTKARAFFDNLPVRNACLWTTLIAGLADQGQGEEALKCFEQMLLEGIPPDGVAYVCSLKACGNVGAANKGREIHAEVARKGLIERDPVVGSILVDMYAKCGSVTSAQQVFDRLTVQGVASWNSLIAGYAQLGDSHGVFHVFDRMLKAFIEPDSVTFISVLRACNHTSLSDKSLTYLDTMRKDYGIIPTIEHHACLVDVLCRTGHLGEALTIIKRMPFCPDLAVWHILLGACRNLGNVELGKEAFEHAVHIDREHAAAYLLMAHINAGAVTKVQGTWRELGTKEVGALLY